MGNFAVTPYVPTITAAALVAGKALSTAPGVHGATTVQIDSTAPSGLYYIHFVQGNKVAAIPPDGAYPAGVTFFHAPIAVLHASGTPDVLTIDDGIAGATYVDGLWVILSTTQFQKTAAAYLLVDAATS